MKHILRYTTRLLGTLMFLAGTLVAQAQPASQRNEVKVYYRVNSSAIDPTYLDNPQSLHELDSLVEMFRMNIDSVTIIAFSSPEGNQVQNMALSKRRASAMHRFLLKKYPTVDFRSIREMAGGPDFGGLTAKVQNDTDIPYRDEVMALTNNWGSNPDQTFMRLRRLREGVPYQYIRSRYLPWMRNSTVIVFHYNRSVSLFRKNDQVGESVSDVQPVTYDINALDPDLMPEEVVDNKHSASDLGIEVDVDYKRFTFYYALDKADLENVLNADELQRMRDFIAVNGIHDTIRVRSYASPEGPRQRNIWLSDHRAQTIVDYLMTFVPAGTSISTVSGGENWEALLEKIRNEYKRPDRERIIDILESDMTTEQMKQALRRQDAASYRFIVDALSPALRTVTVTVPYLKPQEKQEEAEPEIALTPTTQSAESTDSLAFVEELPADSIPVYRREILSVGTNLLLWGMYLPAGYNRWCPVPNVSVEFYPRRGHFTFGASFDCPWWKDYWNQKYFEVRNYQVEARYYFRSGSYKTNPPERGHAFRKLYLQAYAHAGLFGICLDENHGWEGEGAGAGLGIGYVLPLGRSRWRLEFNAQVGYFRAKYDPYQWECPVDPTEQDHLYYYKWTYDADLFKERQYRFNWFGPTRIGITLSYDLLYRRQAKSGVSFRRKEGGAP